MSTTQISCLLGSKFELTLFEGCSSNLSFQDDLPFAVHCKSFTGYIYKTTTLESKICARWKQAKEIALILNDVSSLVCLSHCIPCSPAWWLPCEQRILSCIALAFAKSFSCVVGLFTPPQKPTTWLTSDANNFIIAKSLAREKPLLAGYSIVVLYCM